MIRPPRCARRAVGPCRGSAVGAAPILSSTTLRRRGTGDVSVLSWDVLVSLPGSHTPSLTPGGTAFPGASRSGGLPLVNDTCIHMFLYQRFLCAKATRGIVGLHSFLRRIMRRYLTEATTRPDTRGDPPWRVSSHLPRTISVGPGHLTTHITHITHHFRRPGAPYHAYHAYHAPFPSAQRAPYHAYHAYHAPFPSSPEGTLPRIPR